MKREEAMTLVQDGIAALNNALKAGHSDTLKHFLEVMARFHNYSFLNAALIEGQRPDATHVAGFHTWRKFNRFVRKGESGIAILAPLVGRKQRDEGQQDCGEDSQKALFGFKIAYVFDISQTDGDPLPTISTSTGDAGEWLTLIEESIREQGIILDEDDIPAGASGCSRPGRISIQPGLDANDRFAILAHEWAHDILHQRSERRAETTKTIRETEAEAVAYAVCHACGIDSTTRSADYIQLYRGTEETLRESLTYVQMAAADIISRIKSRQSAGKEMISTAMVA
jgi:antirestriction protein ArdC